MAVLRPCTAATAATRARGRRGPRSKRVIWLTLAALALLQASAAGSQSASEIEDQLKTEFIERFTQFVDWPGRIGGRRSDPFVIGVFGRTSLARNLRELTRRQTIKNRPAQVVQLDGPQGAADCDLLFVASSQADRLPEILSAIGDQPVLTVGDTPGFASQGVLINFVRDSDRLRFEINTAAVERSGLRFSSRLLRLAHLISPKPQS